MCNVVFIEKNFKKTSKEERSAVQKAIDKLLRKIADYQESGVIFEKICNDDSIKYDTFGNGFFTLKSQTQQLPIRILYRFIRTNTDETYIEIHQCYLKKHSDQKRYIHQFTSYVEAYH